jgi:hypothetical protein
MLFQIICVKLAWLTAKYEFIWMLSAVVFLHATINTKFQAAQATLEVLHSGMNKQMGPHPTARFKLMIRKMH